MRKNQDQEVIKKPQSVVPAEVIQHQILFIRGKKVMLDSDLSRLYRVEAKYLLRQVRRNKDRFPDDFMFQLTKKEYEILRCQFGTSRWGGRRYLPLAFTEQGVAMLSSVLNSKRAIAVNIQIMRIFVQLKDLMISHRDLAYKIEGLERKFKEHGKKFVLVFKAIRQLMAPPPEKPKGKMGFHL